MPQFSVNTFGTSQQFSDLQFLLNDSLNGMGDFLTKSVGSLNWIECMVTARALATAKQYVSLMSNQLSPNSSSIFLNRWAQIYNVLGASNSTAIENYIELKQSQFGTPPNFTNLTTYFQNLLGSIFIGLTSVPELIPYATTTPTTQSYNAPLTRTLVYVWQPRDNQDNLLMTNATFNAIVESYHAIIEAWNPAYTEFQTMNLTNRGFQDGYGNNYNGLNYNNYLDGYNVVSASANSTSIVGVGTAFKLYPNGQVGDFQESIAGGFNPPIQIVDDNGVLQTYYVAGVIDNTHLTLTTPTVNAITNRTYRCLGCVLDQSGMLDGGMLMNNGWVL